MSFGWGVASKFNVKTRQAGDHRSQRRLSLAWVCSLEAILDSKGVSIWREILTILSWMGLEECNGESTPTCEAEVV
jgi:hypothetical protein